MNISVQSISYCMAVCFLFGSACALAENDAPHSASDSVSVTQQLAAVSEERNRVLEVFDEASKACWKVFTVNDCLAKARQLKYQQLAPLDQREYELNAQRRALNEIDRRKRLADKEPPKN
jgi:hypothetical protein